jgi:PAS domain S-box-containing protein
VRRRREAAIQAKRTRAGPKLASPSGDDAAALRSELERTRHLYAALSDVNKAIVRARTRDELFDEVCRALVQSGGFDMAWVGWHEPATHAVSVLARHGDRHGYLDAIRVFADDRPEGRGPTGTAIREGRAVVCNDFQNDPITQLRREAAARSGWRAAAMFPIRCGENVCAALAIYSLEQGFFGEAETKLLEGVAADFSFALDRFEQEAVRRRAEDALQESEARYRSLFETMLNGFAHCRMVWDDLSRPVDFVYLEVNEAFGRLTGLANVAGRAVSEVIPGIRELSPEVFERYGRVASTGVPESFEFDFKSQNQWLSIAVYSPRRGEFVAVFVDITEQKRAEAQLRDAKDQLDRAVSAGKIGLWDWDLRTDKVFFSSEWKRQIGYADDEISNDLSEWKTRVHPDDLDEALKTVDTYLQGTDPDYESEFRFRHKDGSYRHILARGSKLLGDDGPAVRLFGSHTDVTERSELQAQFLQAQKMESVGRLAGGIAHDFNNLLTVINGTADLAMMNLRESDPLHADFQEVLASGKRAAVLTRQLLAFSRKQIQKLEILSLNKVIADMLGMLKRMIGEDINLVFVPFDDLGNVEADTGQIEQVVMNLAVNARDAMPDGGALTIETSEVQLDAAFCAAHPSVVPGPYVLLAVSDTGVGMDDAIRRHVFEPFFTTKDSGQGTGLGLSTVYGIVKQSGGSIWLYSEPGVGTAFKIYLPRVEALARKATPPRGAESTRGAETILIVEDEESVRKLVVRILEASGYEVLAASNGGEALLLLERRAQPVHLMLTDVVMPGMNGRELATRLATLHPRMKVLFTSGYTDDAIFRHGVLDEGTHFIGKPYAGADLTRKVREVLDS